MTSMLSAQWFPALLIVAMTVLFFVLERVAPGRALPPSAGWYARACLLNLCQLGLIGLGGLTWNAWWRDHTWLSLGGWAHPAIEGAVYWLAGSFVFYWWHRLRHVDGFWQVFHQVHHSATRIEVATAFYKHPLEMAADAWLSAFLIYGVCGGTAEAGAWASCFGALGTYTCHANLRTPRWLGWFLQRPEHHAIHHREGVHAGNYGDVTIWDRCFGTFREADDADLPCGLGGRAEQALGAMLCWRDVSPAGAGVGAGLGRSEGQRPEAQAGSLCITR